MFQWEVLAVEAVSCEPVSGPKIPW
jgi:hypothetical protein